MASEDGSVSASSISNNNEIEAGLDPPTHDNTTSNNDATSSSNHNFVETNADSSTRDEIMTDDEGFHDAFELHTASQSAHPDMSSSSHNNQPSSSFSGEGYSSSHNDSNGLEVLSSTDGQYSSGLQSHGHDTAFPTANNSEPSISRRSNSVGSRSHLRGNINLPIGFTTASMVIHHQPNCNCKTHAAFRSSLHNGFSHVDQISPSAFASNFHLPDSPSIPLAAHSVRNCFMCEVTNFDGWPENVKRVFSACFDSHQQIRFARSIDHQAEVICYEREAKNYNDARLHKHGEITRLSQEIEDLHHTMNIHVSQGITAQLAIQSYLANFFLGRFTDSKAHHGISPQDLGQKYANTPTICQEHIQKLLDIAKAMSNCNISIRKLTEKRSLCLNDWNVMHNSYEEANEKLRRSRNFFKVSCATPNTPIHTLQYCLVFSLQRNDRELAITRTINYLTEVHGFNFTDNH